MAATSGRSRFPITLYAGQTHHNIVAAITDNSAMKVIQRFCLVAIGVILFAANANAGRWLTRDPLEFMERDPRPAMFGMSGFSTSIPFDYRQQINLYDYVLNNPINYIDPLGLVGMPWDDDSVSRSLWEAIRSGDWDAARDVIEEGSDVLGDQAETLKRAVNHMERLDKWRKQMQGACRKDRQQEIDSLEKTLKQHLKELYRNGKDDPETIKFRYQIDYLKNLLK